MDNSLRIRQILRQALELANLDPKFSSSQGLYGHVQDALFCIEGEREAVEAWANIGEWPKTIICPSCGKLAVEAQATIRFQRGGKVLPVETVQWRCPGECVDAFGYPLIFADLETMKANEAHAKEVWLALFCEEMPKE